MEVWKYMRLSKSILSIASMKEDIQKSEKFSRSKCFIEKNCNINN